MEDSSSSITGLGSESRDSLDYSIPKINMKFDGSTWKKNSEKLADSPKPDASVLPVSDNAETSPACETQPSTSTGTSSSHQPSPASSLSTDEIDGEFEPSVDAMVHDFDDESTLEQEENEEDGESEELDDLAREGEMPLEDLLAMYYTKPGGDFANDVDQLSAVEESEEKCEKEDKTRKLRSNTTFLSPPHPHPDSDDDAEDGDYSSSPPEDCKKAPRVGDDFQVDVIPEVKNQSADYDVSSDKLVWDPSTIDVDKVEDFLFVVSRSDGDSGFFPIPSKTNVRDNEEALYLLTQCNNDTTEAIQRFKHRPPPLSNDMYVWSEEECKQFELGLSLYGKDFHAIYHNKVKTKSIGDIVKFYYIWKKTERYDNFNAKTRLGKKKDALHPGVTDYMERLLDETEQSHSAGQSASVSGGASSSNSVPLSHSAALQQHLVDLRVTRSHARHRPNSHFADCPTTDYSEINGLLDSDFVDDGAGMFENIQPITQSAPHLGNISPSVPFASIEPPIHVGYSDPGQFAPVATTIIAATNNNNNVVAAAAAAASAGEIPDVATHFQAEPSVPTSEPASSSSFRPLDPADITPPLSSASRDTQGLAERRTTPLPLDVLSSIDELRSAYCKSTESNVTSNNKRLAESPSEYPQIPQSPSDPLLHGAKRSRLLQQDLEEDSSDSNNAEKSASSSSSSGASSHSSSQSAPIGFKPKVLAGESSGFKKASGAGSSSSQQGRDKIADPPQLISC